MEKKKKLRLFLDTEFTGLHQNTTLISLGMVTEDGKQFYAEPPDYDKEQVNPWIQENVVDKLLGDRLYEWHDRKDDENICVVQCPAKDLASVIKAWLQTVCGSPDDVEVWHDCGTYDWMLFSELFGGSLKLPSNISYIAFDICTLFKVCGVDPDINREEYARAEGRELKHNALYDAQVTKKCFERLQADYPEHLWKLKEPAIDPSK
jgi:DNA polymerase III epsilon subunit-like protein